MNSLDRYKLKLESLDTEEAEIDRRFIALVEERIRNEDLGDDRTARTRDYLEIWATVKIGSVPRSLLLLWNQAKNSIDPEWKDYQRLKEKFGDA